MSYAVLWWVCGHLCARGTLPRAHPGARRSCRRAVGQIVPMAGVRTVPWWYRARAPHAHRRRVCAVTAATRGSQTAARSPEAHGISLDCASIFCETYAYVSGVTRDASE